VPNDTISKVDSPKTLRRENGRWRQTVACHALTLDILHTQINTFDLGELPLGLDVSADFLSAKLEHLIVALDIGRGHVWPQKLLGTDVFTMQDRGCAGGFPVVPTSFTISQRHLAHNGGVV
jgi:hypothetical protein